jgi:Na+/melibiose symporter-like transporter
MIHCFVKQDINWSPSVCSCLYRMSYEMFYDCDPASCETHTVICLFHAVEIHNKLCMFYVQNVMSDRTVRQWCTMFKDG